MGEQRRPAPASRNFDLLSLGSFVVLGLPDGMLGTAWPSMRATFGAPVGDLGLILLRSASSQCHLLASRPQPTIVTRRVAGSSAASRW
jgi:hypothetical protein